MIFEEKMIALRKELHEFPELSFLENKTAEIIKKFIADTVGDNSQFILHEPFETSVVLEYKGEVDAPYIIFRADMDALPVTEVASNCYVSKNNGKMHACGHDVHMTILCGLISRTFEARPEKNILFVFQPGEEGAGGAKKMMATGFFDNFDIKSAFALHVTDSLAFGEVGSNGDVLFAIPKEVDIVFSGKSGHAAYPENGNDAIAAATSFLVNLEHKIRKAINPADSFLAHFGKISGGKARNIIADEVKIEGTLRAFDRKIMTFGTKEIESFAKNIGDNFGCAAKMTVLGEYLEVRNNPELFELLKEVSHQEGIKCVEKKAEFVGEDFCYFTDRYPGLLFWLGTRMPGREIRQLHSPDFFPHNSVIFEGIKIMFSILLLQ